nr:MAG TPA: hypothetical protein [Caudoviricetes sp.]
MCKAYSKPYCKGIYSYYIIYIINICKLRDGSIHI